MKKIWKLLCVLCILLIAIGFAGNAAYAADRKPSEGLIYAETGNGYYLISIGDCTDTCVVIGATDSNGKKVDGIAAHAFNSFSNGSNIEEIYIEDGIKNIEQFAFYGCNSLKKIRYPEGMTELGSDLFGYFFSGSSVEEVELPSTLKTIAYNAFYGFKNLKKISIPEGVETIDDFAFFGCISLKNIIIPNSVKTIGESAFQECTSLIKISLSSELKEISDYLFKDCCSLKKVELPKNVTKIGKHAFDNCTNLTSVKMYNKVKSLGDFAFNYCSSLKSIKLSKNIKNIDKRAFLGCSKLTKITLPANLEKIGSEVFYGTKIKKLTIPKKVNYLCVRAFGGMSYLESINFKGSKAKYIETEDYYSNDYRADMTDIGFIRITFNGMESNGNIYDQNITLDYYFMGLATYKSLSAEEKKLVKEIKKIVKDQIKIKDSDSYYEKVKKVHDWLVNNTTYALNKKDQLVDEGVNNHDIVFKYHVGVCMNYAMTFKSMLLYLDIPCLLVDSDDMNHAWNMVKMDDGKWYNVDVTWDDPTNNPYDGDKKHYYSTKYFLRDDAHFTDHYGASENRPAAKGTKYEKEVDRTIIIVK